MSFLKSVLLGSALGVSSGSLYADSFDDILGYTKEEVHGIISCESGYSNVDCFEVGEDYMVKSFLLASVSERSGNIIIDPGVNDFYGGCNYERGELGGKKYIVTAAHCRKGKTLDDKLKYFMYRQDDYSSVIGDDLFIEEKKFVNDTAIDIYSYKLNDIQILGGINEILGKDFIIKGEKLGKSFLVFGSIIRIFDNKKRGYIYGEMSVDKENMEEVGLLDSRGMSGSGVYTLDGKKMVGVLSGVHIKGDFPYYFISFFTENSIKKK